MNASETTLKKPDFMNTLLRFVLLMVVAQAVRAGLAWLLNVPVGLDNDVTAPVSLAGMAFFIWLVARPSWQDLALDLRNTTRGTKIAYVALAAIILILLTANFLIDRSLWLKNLYGVLIVPWIEEAFFRGLGWGKLAKALPHKWNGFLTWVLISILFGLWHLGYVDVIALYADQPVNLTALPTVMIWKVLIGGFIGGAAGLVRWKWDKLPGAVFVHAMFNIFGR
jgi:membrane protease YdiL (CAAX protease family)